MAESMDATPEPAPSPLAEVEGLVEQISVRMDELAECLRKGGFLHAVKTVQGMQQDLDTLTGEL
jgi:hypothetical protein